MKKIDVHFHMLGSGRDISQVQSDVYFNQEDNLHWFTRVVASTVEEELKALGADTNKDGAVSTQEYAELALRMLKSSKELDAIVLLGIDAFFHPGGRLDVKRTDLCVSNRFLVPLVRALNKRLQDEAPGKRFYVGASVNPNRLDWAMELGWALDQPETALVKLIPSAQNIRLETVSDDFYRLLAQHKVPLLCHVGPEYAFAEGMRRRALDNFRFLSRALHNGVTVIAAHCASPVFPLVDKNELREFSAFMRDANGGGKVALWADTSALSMASRIPLLPAILDCIRAEWMVHGSDFPVPVDGWPHLPAITHGVSAEEYLRISKTRHPLDRDVRIKRAVGFPDWVLGNASKVLRISS